MKRKIACVLVLGLLLVGCAWLQTVPDTTETVLSKIAARRVGTWLAQHQPVVADTGVQLAQAVVATADMTTIEAFTEFLGTCITDPVLAADINDILSVLDVDEPEMSPERKLLFQQVAGAFIEGVNMGRAR